MTTPNEVAGLIERDVNAIKAHADRVLARMVQTPHGPKRKLLAKQHVDLSNEALRAEGWNEAIAAWNTRSLSPTEAPEPLVERETYECSWNCTDPDCLYIHEPVPTAALSSSISNAEPEDSGALNKTPDWCLRMAELEGDAEIGAGMPNHPLRMPPEDSGEVIQGDRDAAAKIYQRFRDHDYAGWVRAGTNATGDADFVIRTLRYHRLAFSRPEPVGAGEGAAEPFGYWVAQKGAEPALLRKPAYIPEPSELRTITPLYARPEPVGESDPYEGHAAREGMVHAPVGDEALVERAVARLRHEISHTNDPDMADIETVLDALAAIQAIPAPATDAGQSADSLVEAVERFLADYDDGDRADAGCSALMEAHVRDFRASLPKSPSAGEEA